MILSFPASPELITACRAFLVDPNETHEAAIIILLQTDLMENNFETDPDMFVDPRQTKPALIDVLAFEAQGIIRIDLRAATVTAI